MFVTVKRRRKENIVCCGKFFKEKKKEIHITVEQCSINKRERNWLFTMDFLKRRKKRKQLNINNGFIK